MNRKRRRNRASKSSHGISYLSVSPYIDKKVFEYAYNTTKTVYVTKKTEQIMEFYVELIGSESVGKIFEKYLSMKKTKLVNKDDYEELADFSDYKNLKKSIGNYSIIRVIQKYIAPIIKDEMDRLNKRVGRDQTGKKLETLKKVFKLNETEVEIVTFLYIKENIDIINSHFNNSAYVADFDECLTIINRLYKIIGCNKTDIQKALSKGNLSKCGLLEKNGNRISLDDWLIEYISGVTKKQLNEQFCTLFKSETMSLEDLEISKEEKEMLIELVSKKKRAMNILFYGEPGTGKTELAKSLAATTKKGIYIINNKENEKSSDLKRAIIATSNIVDPDNSIILVDEADDLLNTRFSYFLSGEGNSKSWINTFLDENKHKIIWIINGSTYIEPSTMRRFAFSMEFRRFNIKKKVKAFQYQLQKYGLNNYFSDNELKTMSRRYSINAGGIADLIKNIGIRRNSNKQNIIKKINVVLRNHEIAITGRRSKKGKLKELEDYSLNALNTSENLPSLIRTLKAFISRRDDKRLKTLSNMNLLFYGQPGAGKTEFAKYLAQTLDKELLLKRASDLLSCWVGGTEKLIGEAFEEAEENEAILFLDEADSFLCPRDEAIRSWEKTQTNELLTQMENFKGVLICATNFKKGLDHASLRRFKYKVEFKSLNPDGNFEMYKSVLAPYMKEKLTDVEINQIKSLKNLTLGEFHIVLDKLTLSDTVVSHNRLIKLLEDEIKHKPKKEKIIGFGVEE